MDESTNFTQHTKTFAAIACANSEQPNADAVSHIRVECRTCTIYIEHTTFESALPATTRRKSMGTSVE